MLQMADARTSGTAVTRIFSILEVNGRDETKAFDYMKKLRPNIQLYTKSGGGGTLPVGLGQAGGGIFFIVDALDTKAKGYDVTISFPKEGIGTAAEGIALIKGAKNPELGKKLIDWATSPAMQTQFAKYKINFVPAHPDVATGAEPRRGAEGREDLRRSTTTMRAPTASASSTAGWPRSCPDLTHAKHAQTDADGGGRGGAERRRGALASRSGAAVTVAALWLLLALFVLYPLAMLLAPPSSRTDGTSLAPLASVLRQAQYPRRVLEQPAARDLGRRQRHGARLPVRLHRQRAAGLPPRCVRLIDAVSCCR